jgi:hypothetical protein
MDKRVMISGFESVKGRETFPYFGSCSNVSGNSMSCWELQSNVFKLDMVYM